MHSRAKEINTYNQRHIKLIKSYSTFTFSNLADAFIQSNLQMRTIEAIKTNKRATTCKCYDKPQLE